MDRDHAARQPLMAGAAEAGLADHALEFIGARKTMRMDSTR